MSPGGVESNFQSLSGLHTWSYVGRRETTASRDPILLLLVEPLLRLSAHQRPYHLFPLRLVKGPSINIGHLLRA
jgi:hypothetical protein